MLSHYPLIKSNKKNEKSMPLGFIAGSTLSLLTLFKYNFIIDFNRLKKGEADVLKAFLVFDKSHDGNFLKQFQVPNYS